MTFPYHRFSRLIFFTSHTEEFGRMRILRILDYRHLLFFRYTMVRLAKSSEESSQRQRKKNRKKLLESFNFFFSLRSSFYIKISAYFKSKPSPAVSSATHSTIKLLRSILEIMLSLGECSPAINRL